jgi:hypothetical protein
LPNAAGSPRGTPAERAASHPLLLDLPAIRFEVFTIGERRK